MVSLVSIAHLMTQREYFTLSDWKSNPNLSRLAASRDPISEITSSGSIEAIWGFDSNTKNARLFFYCGSDTPRSFLSGENLRGIYWKFYAGWAQQLSLKITEKPSLLELISGLKLQSKPKSINSSNWQALLDYAIENFEIRWETELPGIDFAFITDKYEDTKKINFSSRDRILFEVVSRYYDQFILKNQINHSIPWDALTAPSTNSIDDLVDFLTDPKSFHPALGTLEYGFLWPWQRCLLQPDNDMSSVYDDLVKMRVRPIETTSLVCDLRYSTAAMQLFREPSDYSYFLDRFVSIAKRIVLKYGGYYDKETGDGIVAHFCHKSDNVGRKASVDAKLSLTAVECAREIRRQTRDLCVAVQSKLKQGIGSLRPSIGIHTELSVWLANNGQVRAIGPSVVWAARLCSTALPNEIMISNEIYRRFEETAEIEELRHFQIREISFKEYKEGSCLYGYSDLLEDSFL